MKNQIVRKPDVLGRVQLSDTTLWRLEKAGKFPRRIQLGGNSVGWLADEVDKWIEEKARARANQ